MPRSKNEWSYTRTPQYAFMAWCSAKKNNDGGFFTEVCSEYVCLDVRLAGSSVLVFKQDARCGCGSIHTLLEACSCVMQHHLRFCYLCYRVRPLSNREVKNGDESIIQYPGNGQILVRRFQFCVAGQRSLILIRLLFKKSENLLLSFFRFTLQ
jgi:hypothetical protein